MKSLFVASLFAVLLMASQARASFVCQKQDLLTKVGTEVTNGFFPIGTEVTNGRHNLSYENTSVAFIPVSDQVGMLQMILALKNNRRFAIVATVNNKCQIRRVLSVKEIAPLPSHEDPVIEEI